MDENMKMHFRQLLEQKKSETEQNLEQMKDQGSPHQTDADSYSELSHYDNHPAELATDLFQVQMNNALLVHQEARLKDIREALKRVDKGTYGTCRLCGKEIGTERLDIMPEASLCIDCADEKAADVAEMKNNAESVENELHVKRYLDAWDDAEFEGHDQLNDVLKYGSSDTPQDFSQNRDMEEYYTNEVDNQGIVDDMDKVSNEEYKRQLPD